MAERAQPEDESPGRWAPATLTSTSAERRRRPAPPPPTRGDDAGQDRPTIVYIGGWGRSGSTIIGNILGSVDGWVHVGELRHLWSADFRGRGWCGCGAPFPECPLWRRVLTAWSERTGLHVEDIAWWQRRSTRLRHFPRLALGSTGGSPPDLVAYRRAVSELHAVIADVSGARVLVDSSKHPSEAAMLCGGGARALVVHLVRDPRAVAYSWSRPRSSSDPPPGGLLPRYSSARSSLDWLTWNLAYEALSVRPGAASVLALRYEDFVADPRGAIGRIVAAAQTDPGATAPFRGADEVCIRPSHTIDGNPSRFRHGTVTIREDERWKDAMSPLDRLMATGPAAPLLARYRYRL